MISIVLPVYRNPVLVEYCLDRLLRTVPPDAEILVVDDASGADTAVVLEKFPTIRVVRHPENRGNTAAYNSGAAAANGDVLVFIDSDVIVSAGTISELAAVAASDANIGAAGALLLYPQNYTIQHAGVAFDEWVVTHIYTGRRASDFHFEPLEERQAVTAALFACRRDAYEAVEGFDETYRDGMEDIDFCLKLGSRGLRNVISTSVTAMHIESATRGPYRDYRRTYNYSIFFARWKNRYKVDIDQYLKRSVALLASPYPREQAVRVINFCSTPNWPDLVDGVTSDRFAIDGVHNMSGFAGEHEMHDLYRALPLAFQRLSCPLLFCVDHFSQLTRNAHWFGNRFYADIVVDRHANVLLLDRETVNA